MRIKNDTDFPQRPRYFQLKRLTLAGALLCAWPVAQAATFNVTDISSMEQALYDAANNHEKDTILMAAGTYDVTKTSLGYLLYSSLENYDLTIVDVDLTTPGDVVIQGDGTQELMLIQNTQEQGMVTINGLSFTKGARALRVVNANLEIHHSIFKDNWLTTKLGGYSGGAALRFENSSHTLLIEDSTFESNSANDVSTNYYNRGGAVYSSAKNPIIRNSTFTNNFAKNNGGAIYFASTGGQIESCTFSSNTTSENGGAIFGVDSVVASHFENNQAGKAGGALYQGRLFDRSVFKNNRSTTSAAAVVATSYAAVFTNLIFASNASGDMSEGSSLNCPANSCKVVNSLFDNNDVSGEILVTSNTASANVLANNVFLNTKNNILSIPNNIDPRAIFRNNFMDGAKIGLAADKVFNTGSIFEVSAGLDANYAPLSGSPLIEKGLTDQSEFSLPTTDFNGNARIAGTVVDIGPIEYGSTTTKPKIASFKVSSGSLTQLSDLTFEVLYTLSGSRTLNSVELSDSGSSFTAVTLDENSRFISRFYEAGNHPLVIKITDSEGEYTVSSLALSVGALPVSQIMSIAKSECNADPDSCNIITSTYYNNGVNWCKSNPESCGVNTSQFIQQGKNQCIDNPASCGIPSAAFNASYIPVLDNTWKLLGTSQAITSMSIFANVDIVWAQINGTWRAYSPNAATQTLLSGKGISTLSFIPAYSGFWVKK